MAAAALRAAGFLVREEPFVYSELVGRWGTPLAGAASIAALAGAAWLGARGHAGTALGTLLATLGVGAAVGAWAARRGVLDAPALRRDAVNLVATRGGVAPRVWLVAHLDSKSQPVPIGVRAAGVMGTIAAWGAALALAGTAAAGRAIDARTWAALAALGTIAGLPVLASVVTARSPGALDDASGVATVLLAAEEAGDAPLGVLLTSAEELGLAGARAWVAQRGARGEAPGIALNVDGVDDAGVLTAMVGARAPREVVQALREVARGAGVALGVRRLVPGILVDAVALAAGGWATLTLSRGTWRTLARIHTPADTADRLDGRGIAEAAVVLARAARALAARDGAPRAAHDASEAPRGAQASDAARATRRP